MRTICAAPNHFIHATALFTTFFFMQQAAAAIRLEGTVVSAETGLPLDSVRVASLTDGTITWTQRDGRFLYERPVEKACKACKACPPGTAAVDSLHHYTMRVTSTDRLKTVITGNDKPPAISLWDLQGRVVERTAIDQSFMRFPGKLILQGFEWNAPGYDEASVGFISDADQPDAVARFEYLFDWGDPDTSMPWLPKSNQFDRRNTLTALEWMKRHYPSSSYCFLNHPSRLGINAIYTVNDFRDFNNRAPDICLGFEGMPGHQRRFTRGGYSFTPTYGGADLITARIGGIWDALLGEGRHFWTIANSDFHADDGDFWPGEYSKTWTAAVDTGARAWLDGLRSGDVFAVHGDLISHLDFSIDDGIRIVDMGGDLNARGSDLTLTIRFASPATNNNGDSVRVDHIDLIAGEITGRADPSDIAAYTDSANPTTRVIRRFTYNIDWVAANGLQVIRLPITCTQPTYYRLRGTNLPAGTPGETDKAGNPLADEAGTNTEGVARQDLWFYSNPIFVYPGRGR